MKFHYRVRFALYLCAVFFAPQIKAITSADVLPQGVRAGAFVFGEGQGVQDRLNANGALESLVAPINRSLTINDLAAYNEKLKLLQTALNSLGSQNLGDKVLQVDLYQDLAVTERRYVTGLLWGVTNAYSVGVIVPIVGRDYTANFRAETRDNIAQLRALLGNAPGVQEAFNELQSAKLDTARFADELFHSNGYKTPTSFTARGLGDVEIEGRWGYFKSDRLNLQFRHTLRVPTASHVVDLTNLLDRPLGQNHYSLRLAQQEDLKIIPHILSWNTSTSATLRAPGHQLLAIKKSPDQILPDLNDPEQIEVVRKQSGTDLSLDSGLMLDLWRGVISLSSAYTYNVHFQDNFSGKRALQYGDLNRDTQWQLHSIDTGIEVSTIPLYLGKKIPVPARLSLTWSQPIKGVNTEFAPYGRVDFVLLF